jgi:N-acyl-D-amino-acid deacylase
MDSGLAADAAIRNDESMHDILIRGGILYDGAGTPGVAADLAIANGRIAAIDPLPSLPRKRGRVREGVAHKIIDAQNLAVAPGFIDIKTHSDFTLPINPKAESKVRQGVTTEIIGHCGFSVAPALPGKVELLKDYLSPSAPWLPFRETTFPDYLQTFPPTAVNAGMLVGHNTLRLMVMGMAERAPTAAELAQMIVLLEDALDAGALGLSSGLFTPPGSYAEAAEMIALGHVLKRHNAGYFTHLRDESNKVIEAVAEAIAIGEQCGVHVEIVHFKCSGMDNWGKAAQALAMIADAKARGIDVDCDSYPYAAGSNPLKNILPPWVQAGGVEAMIARLGESETRQKIRADIARDGLNNWGRIPSWDCVQISISPHLPQFSGRTIASLAAERGADPIDTLCDYLADDQGATRVLVTSIAEADIRTIVASPLALVGSDGNCVAPYGAVGKGMPHPRFYGTFPRILSHYVRDENALPLPLAIHKMTGATARALKLKDRGLLREGFCADVVLFDPDDFIDRATYADPHQFPSGARTTVIVNGTIVVENATHTGALPGKVLRRDAKGAVL